MKLYPILKQGEHFRVEVYRDHVKKYPKTDFHKESLPDFVFMQNHLADHIKGVLPAEHHGGYLTMAVPPGKQASEYPESVYYEKILPKVERMEKAAKKIGYNLQGIRATDNIFYDDENDIVYPIDFSSAYIRGDNPDRFNRGPRPPI